MFDDEPVKKPKGHEVGMPIDTMSVEELSERVGLLAARPSAVHPQASLVDAARVRGWRRRGLDVNVWTVDDPADLERLARLGVSAVITNRPAIAVEVLRRAR